MKKLKARGQKWLKAFHVVFACMWVGSAIFLSVKQFFINPDNGGELYGITSTMDFIDIWIIIPGAIGVLLTGLIYSIWTNWGWFKHNWIIVKWCICLYGVIFGTYPLGPWMSGMAKISEKLGMEALSDPTFMSNQRNLIIFGTFQACTLIFAIFITTLKPWKKRKK
jgi:hypothetical protein